jgi:hypothetical protein
MTRSGGSPGGDAPDGAVDVLVFKSLGAEPQRGRLSGRGRRPKRAQPESEAPAPVPISRVTVIASDAFANEEAARDWLASCRDEKESARELDYAMRRVNRAVQAHRLASSDPYVGEVDVRQARRVRLGYGTGDELVEGAWRDAWAVPVERTRRSGRRALLAPQEQVARILSGRRPPQPSEDILLRARLDLDEGRTRQAALQARAGHGALQAELRTQPGAEQIMARLRSQAELISRLATVALERELDAEQAAKLHDLLTAMERITRRRRHALGPDGSDATAE